LVLLVNRARAAWAISSGTIKKNYIIDLNLYLKQGLSNDNLLMDKVYLKCPYFFILAVKF